jgi:transcriptional regulator with XRE-family HTH domain
MKSTTKPPMKASAPLTAAPTAKDGAKPRTSSEAQAPRVPRKATTSKPKAGEPAENTGWRRLDTDKSVGQELGARIRANRESRGLSLAQLSDICGVPAATLSRIENNRMSPTFGVVSRVMMGLDIDWTALVAAAPAEPGERVMSVADAGGGETASVRTSEAKVLHSHDKAHLLPLMVEVHARTVEEVGGLIGHRGEEFVYVLSGTLQLHVEGRPVRTLRAGASALFDSATPHAYVAGSATGCKILLVVLRAYGAFKDGGPLS